MVSVLVLHLRKVGDAPFANRAVSVTVAALESGRTLSRDPTSMGIGIPVILQVGELSRPPLAGAGSGPGPGLPPLAARISPPRIYATSGGWIPDALRHAGMPTRGKELRSPKALLQLQRAHAAGTVRMPERVVITFFIPPADNLLPSKSLR